MFIKRAAGAVGALILGTGLALALGSPVQADDNTLSFEDAGPVDLSGTADPTKPNAGEHVTLGSLDLGPGEWTIAATVRLFVADPDPTANGGKGAWKNSQGCGVYVGGEQAAGAGGSSGLWSATEGGKEIVFAAEDFLQPPDWLAVPLVLQVDEAATVELVCFIDQSHSGATFEQRASFVATDIALTATKPALCKLEGLTDLLAGDEKCVEPDPSPSATPSPEVSESPAPGVAGGVDAELPVTGSNWVPGGVLVAVLLAGSGALLVSAVRRRRRPLFTLPE